MHPGLEKAAADERDPACEAVAHKLRELPSEAPPPFDWTEMQQRIRAGRAHRQLRVASRHPGAGQRRTLAAVIGVVAIAMAVLLSSRIEWVSGGLAKPFPAPRRLQTVTSRTHMSTVSEQMPAAPESHDQVLMARAERAERWLARRPDDRAVVQVSSQLVVAELEGRIASMDDLLNLERVQHAHPSRIRVLQLQRAQLLDSLAQVRYAQMLLEDTP